MIRDIVQIGHPALREVASPLAVDEITSQQTQQVLKDLLETLHAANGAGIAAPQLAIPLRVFLVEVRDNPRYPFRPRYPLTYVINPEITFLTKDRFPHYEGCLSIPQLRGIVPRCPEIRVQGLGHDGAPLDFEVRGISAGVFQHEYDHLEGILFTDRVEDTKSYCTVDEFQNRYQNEYRRVIDELTARYET